MKKEFTLTCFFIWICCIAVFPRTNPNQCLDLFTSVSLSNPVCSGGNTGFILVDVTGGTTPYTYTWEGSTPHFGPSATNLAAGNYTLTVTDATNCSATVTAALFDPAPMVVVANASAAKCYNTAGKLDASVTGGKAPYNYLLNGVGQGNGTFKELSAGDYLLVVTDVNGCQGNASFSVIAPKKISVSLGASQQTILTGMQTQLIATPDSNSTILNYFWSPDSLLDFTACTDPANCASPMAAPRTTTTFTVWTMNTDSCRVSDTITVYVNNEPSKFIPTAFTPNGDGMNDRFEFDILGATKIEVSIFDRWGERIYHNANQENGVSKRNGWDGLKDGKMAAFDTYVYQMRITYWNDVSKDISGTVTLMK